jgi:hypothetical protein
VSFKARSKDKSSVEPDRVSNILEKQQQQQNLLYGSVVIGSIIDFPKSEATNLNHSSQSESNL